MIYLLKIVIFQKIDVIKITIIIFTGKISSRIKRSPYLYPYRQIYHQYFVDEKKRDVDGKYSKCNWIKIVHEILVE